MIAQLQALVMMIRTDQDGQGLAEYSLVLALVAVLALGALTLIGAKVVGLLNVNF